MTGLCNDLTVVQKPREASRPTSMNRRSQGGGEGALGARAPSGREKIGVIYRGLVVSAPAPGRGRTVTVTEALVLRPLLEDEGASQSQSVSCCP